MSTFKLNNDDKSWELFKKTIRGKTLMDDRYMSAYFRDFKEGVELVVGIILDKPDIEVLEIHAQDTLSNLYGRTVRIDIYAKDSKGVRYNIEIQRKKDGAGCKRARYHSSMLDANLFELIGEDFEELPRSIVIFICESDFFGKDLPIYTINRKIEETGESFADEAAIVYVNGGKKDHNTALGRLMEDFFNPDPDTMNYDILANKSRMIKNLEKGSDNMQIVREYLTEEDWNAALKEGEKRGERQENNRGISIMIHENFDENIPVDRIVIKLGKYYNLKPEEALARIEKEKETYRPDAEG